MREDLIQKQGDLAMEASEMGQSQNCNFADDSPKELTSGMITCKTCGSNVPALPELRWSGIGGGTISELVEFLNGLLAIDRDAIQKLILTRVPCNNALADHPNVQIWAPSKDDPATVGLLGILNGFACTMKQQFIVAEFDEDMNLLKFSIKEDVSLANIKNIK